jgi:hypothetical protein
MASSIQIRSKKIKRFNDLDLIAIICLIYFEATRIPDEYPTILPTIKRWHRDLLSYGPGTIDLDLDKFPASALAVREFLAATNAVKAVVSQFGEILPASVLNEKCHIPGVKFSDYLVGNIEVAIQDLSFLLIDQE